MNDSRGVARRVALSGAGIGLVCSAGALLSLLASRLGAPWFPFVPGYLLLGATGLVVATVALYAERNPLAVVAFLCSLVAPTLFLIWLAGLEPGALS